MLQKTEQFNLVAQTFLGLEGVLVAELEQLGATSIKKLSRAVQYRGDKKLLYNSNLWLRTATRVLKPIAEFVAHNEQELYDGIQRIDWREYLDVERTLAVNCVVKSEIITHSQYAALKTKDAIVDQFRGHYGVRPSVDVQNPDLRIHLYIYQDRCFVSLDSSGESLHRRGYRQEGHVAPLNEVSAAGLVLLSGWDNKMPFIDPMCGSGTIAVEAAMLAHHIAPGIYRQDFGFIHWKDFDEALWESLYDQALSATAYTDTQVFGSDISAPALRMAQANIGRTTLGHTIKLAQNAFQDWQPPAKKGLVIMNPPYDERIRVESIHELYKMIGGTLKSKYQGYTAWVLSASKEGLKSIGLQATKNYRIFNGALECGFNKYEIF